MIKRYTNWRLCLLYFTLLYLVSLWISGWLLAELSRVIRLVGTSSGVTKVGDTRCGNGELMVSSYFSSKNWRPFLVIVLWKGRFLALVLSPLPASPHICPIFFVNSTTKNYISFGCHPWIVSGVTRGGPPLPLPVTQLGIWKISAVFLISVDTSLSWYLSTVVFIYLHFTVMWLWRLKFTKFVLIVTLIWLSVATGCEQQELKAVKKFNLFNTDNKCDRQTDKHTFSYISLGNMSFIYVRFLSK